jgi:hypothetical protein
MFSRTTPVIHLVQASADVEGWHTPYIYDDRASFEEEAARAGRISNTNFCKFHITNNLIV